MKKIELRRKINASISECFDLSRSIDLHITSMNDSNEKAVGGKISGLINLGEHVTWEAKHFGVNLKLTSRITEMENPHQFTDEMINGPFKYMKHQHIFREVDDHTEMTDIFELEAPFIFIGLMVEKLILKAYLTNLLAKRNLAIKKAAEQKSPELIQDFQFI